VAPPEGALPEAAAAGADVLQEPSSRVCTSLLPSVIDSVNRPVCRSGDAVVLTRMRYGPLPGNTCATRAEHPGPPLSLMIDSSRSEPRMIRTGLKSSEARSMVIGRPAVVVN